MDIQFVKYNLQYKLKITKEALQVVSLFLYGLGWVGIFGDGVLTVKILMDNSTITYENFIWYILPIGMVSVCFCGISYIILNLTGYDWEGTL